MKFLKIWLAALAVLAAGFIAGAPSASADSCTGHRGCSSGWQTTVYHNAYGLQIDVTVSQTVTWWSDDIRTVYYSGSYCLLIGSRTCHRMDEARIYWAVPGSGVWTEDYRESPGPNYGYWDSRQLYFYNGDLVKGFWVKFRYDDHWFATPIVYN